MQQLLLLLLTVNAETTVTEDWAMILIQIEQTAARSTEDRWECTASGDVVSCEQQFFIVCVDFILMVLITDDCFV